MAKDRPATTPERVIGWSKLGLKLAGASALATTVLLGYGTFRDMKDAAPRTAQARGVAHKFDLLADQAHRGVVVAACVGLVTLGLLGVSARVANRLDMARSRLEEAAGGWRPGISFREKFAVAYPSIAALPLIRRASENTIRSYGSPEAEAAEPLAPAPAAPTTPQDLVPDPITPDPTHVTY